jgi:7-carboxy-7-deazaguanine synthase
MVTAKPKTIPLAEVFGPTIQGEGALAGRSTYFVRLGGCDYTCVWCDSSHAVLPMFVSTLPRLTQEEIYEKLLDLPMGPEWLTISGGNPALFDLTELVSFWQKGSASKVAVETQGSRWADWLGRVDLLTVSPKPPSSGLDAQTSIHNLDDFMSKLMDSAYRKVKPLGPKQAVLKVVVFDDEDFEYARKVHAAYPEFDFYLSVGTAMGGLAGNYIPPAIGLETFLDKFAPARTAASANGTPTVASPATSHGTTVTWTQRGLSDNDRSLLDRYRWLADKVKGDISFNDVAVLPQLHVLLWGHTKGV